MLKKEKRYDRGRHCLLVAAVFTAANAALALAGRGNHILFSVFAPYIQSVTCRSIYEETGEALHLIIGAASALLVIALVALCWTMAEKKKGWLLAGLVLMAVDTLDLLYFCTVFDGWDFFLLDFVFHGIILLEMTIGAFAAADGPVFESKHEPIDTWNRRRKY